MILTAGLTPAWQQVMEFEHLRIGEVNRASAVTWLAQGKVINAGIGAHTLGGPSLTLAPLGGPAVLPMDRELVQLGVPHRWIETETSTRVCTTLLDKSTGGMTELVENGRPLKANELEAFLKAYAEEAAKADVAVITGSLPTGTPNSYYHDLVKHSPCPVLLDFRGEGLLGTLDLKPMVVKPNREELTQTVGHPILDDEQLIAAMRALNERGAQWVVITQGSGPIWMSSSTRLYRFRSLPIVSIVNPIGSGDAMAAGIAWALRAGRDIVNAVQWGIASATDNLRQLETCRLNRSWVQEQAERVLVEQVV